MSKTLIFLKFDNYKRGLNSVLVDKYIRASASACDLRHFHMFYAVYRWFQVLLVLNSPNLRLSSNDPSRRFALYHRQTTLQRLSISISRHSNVPMIHRQILFLLFLVPLFLLVVRLRKTLI